MLNVYLVILYHYWKENDIISKVSMVKFLKELLRIIPILDS